MAITKIQHGMIDVAAVDLENLSATGTANNKTYLRGDNTWSTVSASPAGSDTQIQYNSSGSFAGSSNSKTLKTY